jgi:PA14 domain
MKQQKTVLGIAAILALLLLVQGVAASYDPGWTIGYYPGQTWGGGGAPSVLTNDQVFIQFADPTSGYPSAIANWPYGIIGLYQDYSILCDGYVDIPAAGDYTFITTSDDGVELFVNGVPVISNTGDHAPTVDTATVNLPAGYQHVVVKYRENIYGSDPTVIAPGNIAVISLEYAVPGAAPQLVPGWHVSSTPAPEFPSACLPATFIVGMLGTVLLIRRMKED